MSDQIKLKSPSSPSIPIIPKISNLNLNKPKDLLQNFELQNADLSKSENLPDLLRKYNGLLREHTILNNQISLITSETNLMKEKFNQLQNEKDDDDSKKKRQRRKTEEIARNFVCFQKNCNKSYGSEGSLIQHLRLKHAEKYNDGKYDEHLNKRVRKQSKDQASPLQSGDVHANKTINSQNFQKIQSPS